MHTLEKEVNSLLKKEKVGQVRLQVKYMFSSSQFLDIIFNKELGSLFIKCFVYVITILRNLSENEKALLFIVEKRCLSWETPVRQG